MHRQRTINRTVAAGFNASRDAAWLNDPERRRSLLEPERQVRLTCEALQEFVPLDRIAVQRAKCLYQRSRPPGGVGFVEGFLGH